MLSVVVGKSYVVIMKIASNFLLSHFNDWTNEEIFHFTWAHIQTLFEIHSICYISGSLPVTVVTKKEEEKKMAQNFSVFSLSTGLDFNSSKWNSLFWLLSSFFPYFSCNLSDYYRSFELFSSHSHLYPSQIIRMASKISVSSLTVTDTLKPKYEEITAVFWYVVHCTVALLKWSRNIHL